MDHPYLWFQGVRDRFQDAGWDVTKEYGEMVISKPQSTPCTDTTLLMKLIVGKPERFWNCRHLIEFPFELDAVMADYLDRITHQLGSNELFLERSGPESLVITWSCFVKKDGEMIDFNVKTATAYSIAWEIIESICTLHSPPVMHVQRSALVSILTFQFALNSES